MNEQAMKRRCIVEDGVAFLSPPGNAKRRRMVTPTQQLPAKIPKSSSTRSKKVLRVKGLLTDSNWNEEDAEKVARFLAEHTDHLHCPERCKIDRKGYRVNKFYYDPNAPFSLLVLKHLNEPEEFLVFVPHGDKADKFIVDWILKKQLVHRIEDDLDDMIGRVMPSVQNELFVAGQKRRISSVLAKLQNSAHIRATLSIQSDVARHEDKLGEVVATQVAHGARFDSIEHRMQHLEQAQAKAIQEQVLSTKQYDARFQQFEQEKTSSNKHHEDRFQQYDHRFQQHDDRFQQHGHRFQLVEQEQAALKQQQALLAPQLNVLEQQTKATLSQFENNLAQWQQGILRRDLEQNFRHCEQWIQENFASNGDLKSAMDQLSSLREQVGNLPSPVYHYSKCCTINSVLRSGKVDPKSRVEANCLIAALVQLPLCSKPLVFRGLKLNEMPDGWFDNLKATGLYSDPGFSSTTLDRSVALQFATLHEDIDQQDPYSRMLMRIKHRTGRHVKSLVAFEYEWEDEVIFLPDAKFRLEKIDMQLVPIPIEKGKKTKTGRCYVADLTEEC